MALALKHANVCPVCSRSQHVITVYGTVACRACAAFFARSVKEQRSYECKADARVCSALSIQHVTGIHACKKCRFERCLKEGMAVKALRCSNPTARKRKAKLPLISKVIRAVIYVKCKEDNYDAENSALDLFTSQKVYHKEAIFFWQLFNHLPVICELALDAREELFRMSVGIFVVFMQCMENSRRICEFSRKEQFFPFPGRKFTSTTVDISQFLHLNFYPIQSNVLLPLERMFLTSFFSQQTELTLEAMDLFKSEEDIAAFILLIVIQTNEFRRINPFWEQPLSRLKNIMKELDLHYRNENEQPALWGNMIFFFSNLQTATNEFVASATLLNLYRIS